MQDNLINSIKKCFQVLDILAFEDLCKEGVSLTNLSHKTGIKPNTLHNILKTMIYCGYVEQNSKSKYLSGKRCTQIGLINKFKMTPNVSKALNKSLHNLRANINESVSFYVLHNGDRINYSNIVSNDIIKVDYTMLEENSIYQYPTGRILVAYCCEDELEILLRKHGFPNQYWDNISNMDMLKTTIDSIIQDGYCSKISYDGKVVSFAVPVFLSNRKLLGTMGVYMPAFRATDEKSKQIIDELKLYSKELLCINEL